MFFVQKSQPTQNISYFSKEFYLSIYVLRVVLSFFISSLLQLLEVKIMPKSKGRTQRAARAPPQGAREVETPHTSAEGELCSSWPGNSSCAHLAAGAHANLQQPALCSSSLRAPESKVVGSKVAGFRLFRHREIIRGLSGEDDYKCCSICGLFLLPKKFDLIRAFK